MTMAPIERPEDIKPAISASLLVGIVALFLVVFVLWAGFAELDKVTRGDGRVIPSRQVQVVQNLEGGIVKEILVRQGDRVKAGDVLLRMDGVAFDAEFRKTREEYLSLAARFVRLEAEADLRQPVFPDDLLRDAPDYVAAERALAAGRRNDLDVRLSILSSRLDQRRQALAEATSALANAEKAMALARAEHEIIEPLVSRGLQPRVELVRADQRLTAATGERDLSRLAMERSAQAITETEREIESTGLQFKAEALEALTEVKRQRDLLERAMPAMEDRVERTEVRSPLGGIVNRVLVHTIGGVAQPGMPLVEVVPLDDTLLIEARIRPEDIAFLAPGLDARVKLTAYDFAVYGALPATVEHISADAVTDEKGERFYIAQVRTTRPSLGRKGGTEELPILPGMVAQVDILTGKRSVLDYILTPIVRVRDTAFRES
ncbi:HlyD family type I secretion periplasmic adaptor subunit [Zavarzinia compransoris]|uniref:Membrane fusion protein (MFP) family protein n=1 Tax=Zavarzinia compransoris TaxID=1264899 RepID=A0A317ECP4_9PROT|nr:HlyD family type I secretion periplasmic adaptor subunit [Zavarzinia compransoris]PWR23900.1 HlyD family type I secretion periplasmic adaptor subunit [Zavarzinia compransoris]TDP48144.1 adhesin transport system membrane fusion protein [Zavarzinia compransoris]